MRDNSALRDSEARYQALFESIADAVFIHDRQGNIWEVNPAACRRLGYSREELLSRNLQDIDPDFTRLAPELRAASEITAISFSRRSDRRDGSAIPRDEQF